MSPDRVSRRSFLARACGGSLAAACGTLRLPAVLAALPVTEITGRTEGLERAYPIPAADGVSIDRTEAVIIVRYRNEAFALALTCPHENAAVKWLRLRVASSAPGTIHGTRRRAPTSLDDRRATSIDLRSAATARSW